MRWMILSFLVVSACGVPPERNNRGQVPEIVAENEEGDVQTRPQARPSDQPEEVAAPTPEMSIGTLGRTVASLGNAAEPGLWLKTPLVAAERTGRVHNPKTGQSVAVTLIPIEGERTAGSRMSLAAMQAIGASLTDLVEVDVFGS